MIERKESIVWSVGELQLTKTDMIFKLKWYSLSESLSFSVGELKELLNSVLYEESK